MGRVSDATNLHALIGKTRSHFLSFQKEFLLVLESLVDIACALLEQKKGTFRHQGLLSIFQQFHGLLDTMIQRLADGQGDAGTDIIRRILLSEASRIKGKKPHTREERYRMAGIETVLAALNRKMKTMRPHDSAADFRGFPGRRSRTNKTGGRAGKIPSERVKKVIIK